MNPHHAIPQQLGPDLDLPECDGLVAVDHTTGQPDHATVTDCPRLGAWAHGH